MIFSETLYNSYRRAGILAEAGRGISASETSDGVAAFNSMIELWRIQRLTVWAEFRQKFDLVSGQQEYKIGTDPAADWQATMPTTITRAGYIFTWTSPEVEQPFNVYTVQQWQAISPKNLQSTNPYVAYYMASTVQGAVSVMGTMILYPVPTDASIQVALYLWMQLLKIDDPTQTVIFPPGYQEAVESNLAVRLAAMFPKRQKISPITVEIAKSSFARIKASNSQPIQMRVEAGDMGSNDQPGTYNLLSNAYNNRII